MPRKQKNKASGSIVLMVIGGLLIVGAITGFLFMLPRGSSQSSGGQVSNNDQSAQGIEGNFPNIERVSIQDARAAYDQGSAVFVDVRTPEEYDQGRIVGALSIPLLDLPDRIGELDPNAWIITY